MTPLTIVANIKAKADKAALVKVELERLVGITRVEEECIQYDWHQDNDNPVHFMFYENWLSRMGAQHWQDYMAATDGAVDELMLNEMTVVA